MDLTLEEALARLEEQRKVSAARCRTLAAALATYVRTILAGDSPYDRYVAGDRNALTVEQTAGLRLFRGKANCAACHLGPNLSDEEFHNTGTGWVDGRFTDEGRFTVTGRDRDRGAFKRQRCAMCRPRAVHLHDGSLRRSRM